MLSNKRRTNQKPMKPNQEETNLCPNCKVPFQWTRVTDVNSGDVLITASVDYCPKCLYVYSGEITISR